MKRDVPARRLRNRGRNDAMCPKMTQEAGMHAQAKTSGLAGNLFPVPPDEANGAPDAGSRALVPVHPADVNHRCDRSRYPSATFLAHLIAVDRRLPQTRGRGRTAP